MQEISGSDGTPIGAIEFDDWDGSQEYQRKKYNPSKIDQVLNYYGIPFIYKDEWRKYLKYRIEPRHYWVVNDYFIPLLKSMWYDVTDRDFGKEQDEYKERVPVAEQTGLDMHIDYDAFLLRDKQHQESLQKENANKQTDQNKEIMNFMQDMMKQMKELWDQVQELKQPKQVKWVEVLSIKKKPNEWKNTPENTAEIG